MNATVPFLSVPEAQRIIHDPLFELELGALLEASFPQPGDASRVRPLIEADAGVDDLGIGAHRIGGAVRFAYPIAVVAGIKSAKPV